MITAATSQSDDVRGRAEVEHGEQRPARERQEDQVREPEPHAVNVISPTHFVLCTPGSAGTMIRAG